MPVSSIGAIPWLIYSWRICYFQILQLAIHFLRGYNALVFARQTHSIKEDSRCLSSLATRAATPVAAPFGRFSAGSAAASVADMTVLAQPIGWAVLLLQNENITTSTEVVMFFYITICHDY